MQHIKKPMMITLQIGGICLFYEIIGWCVSWLSIPVPANVLGMLTMIILLWAGIIPLKMVVEGAEFLLKYMPVLFVPFGVAMMNYGGLIKQAGVMLIPVLIITSILVPAITGYSTLIWYKWQEKKKGMGIRANIT